MQAEPDRSDAELVRAAAAGDAWAYRELVARHETRVFRFLARHVRSADDAEDLAQETFLQAYKSLAAYRGEAKFTTWLIGIALNLARNHANRSLPVAVPDDGLECAPAAGPDPEEVAVCAAKLDAVQRALGELPEEQGACVSLILFEGCSYEEASRLLQVPTGTVKSRLARARARLAAALKDF